MNTIDISRATQFAVALRPLLTAAKEVFYQGDFTVSKKADNSAVTLIDTVLQEGIVRLCQEFFGADIVIIAEEDEGDHVSETMSPWTAYIDPVDGTAGVVAQDLSWAHVSIGIFYNGAPFLGFIGAIQDETVIFGGSVLGNLFEVTAVGEVKELVRRPISFENKLIAFEIGQVGWSNPLVKGTLLSLFAQHDTPGGKHYCLPCVMVGTKLLLGNCRYYIGVPAARPWDVAALLALFAVRGMHLVSLETGKTIVLGHNRDVVGPFVMADSPESLREVLSLRPAI